MGQVSLEMAIINKRGLHARASAKFATLANSFDGITVQVEREDQVVDGSSIMDLMMLAAGQGATITVHATAQTTRDEQKAQEALDALAALVADRFGEGE